jgi:hypothetical protein
MRGRVRILAKCGYRRVPGVSDAQEELPAVEVKNRSHFTNKTPLAAGPDATQRGRAMRRLET